MAQIRLLNCSGRTLKTGTSVKIHPKLKNSCDFASLGDIIIGTINKGVMNNCWAVIDIPEIIKEEEVIKIVEPLVSNVPKISFSNTEPINPSVNEIWIDTTE